MNSTISKIILICIDAVLINIAVYITLSVRFAGQIPLDALKIYVVSAPIFTGVTLICLLGFNVYNHLLEFASIDEAIAIIKAVSLSVLLVVAITSMTNLPFLPRSIYIGSWLNVMAFIGGSRLLWRAIRDHALENNHKEATRRVLIVGAGSGGALLAREIHNNPALKRTVVGFVDDDVNKYKMILAGVPVLGYIDKIPIIVKDSTSMR